MTKGKVIAIFISLLTGYVAARYAFRITSLINPDRLVSFTIQDVIYATPLVIILSFFGTILVSRFRIRQAIGWFLAFFTLRIFASLVLTMLFQYDDERAFHYAGIEQVYGIASLGGGKAYYHLINILYLIFGTNILLPKIVNAFLGSLLPFFAFGVAYWLFSDRKAGWRAFLLIGLLPPFVIFSAVNLKEMATCLLFVWIGWILANPKNTDLRKLVDSAVPIFLLYLLRGAIWTIIGILGIIVYFILRARWRSSSLVKTIMVVALIGWFFVFPISKQIQQMVWSRTTQEEYFIKRFSESETGVMRYLYVENPFSPKNLVVLSLRGLFSPSPLRFLMSYGIDTHLEALNMLVWYILFPMAIMGILAYRRNRAAVACALMGIGILMIATTGIMVGSDPYRHRMVAMGLIAILAVGGFKKEIMLRFRWVIWLWILGAVSFTGMWFTLRIGG
jgi:hypothetical protein